SPRGDTFRLFSPPPTKPNASRCCWALSEANGPHLCGPPVSETEGYSAVTVTGSVTDLEDSEDIALITRVSQIHSHPTSVAVSGSSSDDMFKSIVVASDVEPVLNRTNSSSNPEHCLKAAMAVAAFFIRLPDSRSDSPPSRTAA